jgi:hypothetical protein
MRILAMIALFAASAATSHAQLAQNIIQRVLLVRYGPRVATGFTLDVDTRQYLITAAHVVDGLEREGKIQIRHDEKWEEIAVKRLSVPMGIDIAVLAPRESLTPNLELPEYMGLTTYGSDVFFLGFPYGSSMPSGTTNNLHPLPFVKKAIVSALFPSLGVDKLYLDGINNPGFSGGPVVVLDPHDLYPEGTPKVKIIGVISGFRNEKLPVMDGENRTPLTVTTNTGIIEAVSIRYAIDAIHLDPIGASF